MPDFKYEVIAKNGKTQRGKIGANSQLDALQLLNSKGYVVTSIKAMGG